MHPRTPARRAVPAAARGLVLPLAAALVWATPTPAAAHTDLVSSAPAQGASLDGPPSSIRLTFSDEMTERYAKVALTAPDGTPAGQGDPQVEGKTATLTVKSGLGAGRYTVGYRVVSADGHPVAGSYSFTVKAASPTPSMSASAPAPRVSNSPSAPAAVGQPSKSTSTAGPVLVALGGALVVAVGAVIAWRRRTRHGG
ncbi:copper resistance protein CopC [Streptomyces sp. P9(2023)]|uniref:copper resistance CopC family protein n=1 Tax=Streptomyces sp. P9(2023) TaxID=3064394 RepID=UPI0028F42C97|nr:copper resistance protein CopC [Streptomyces sp. P9(2023)]MDT9687407.1 copper resistance protein CopC [Streptomyces sp. P9(2023)]